MKPCTLISHLYNVMQLDALSPAVDVLIKHLSEHSTREETSGLLKTAVEVMSNNLVAILLLYYTSLIHAFTISWLIVIF